MSRKSVSKYGTNSLGSRLKIKQLLSWISEKNMTKMFVFKQKDRAKTDYHTSVKLFLMWQSGDKIAIFHSSWINKLLSRE